MRKPGERSGIHVPGLAEWGTFAHPWPGDTVLSALGHKLCSFLNKAPSVREKSAKRSDSDVSSNALWDPQQGHKVSSPQFPPESRHRRNSALMGVGEGKADHVCNVLALSLRNGLCDDD